jgi:hypothetical protein
MTYVQFRFHTKNYVAVVGSRQLVHFFLFQRLCLVL